MIDPADRQTQPLPLDEQSAKRRGRPSTGQALSNAERQRLYRERQKAQRNDKSETTDQAQLDEIKAIALELGERCKRAEDRRDELHDQVQQLQRQRDELIRECKALKKELASRPTVTAIPYDVLSYNSRNRQWYIVGCDSTDNEPFASYTEAQEFVARIKKTGGKGRYRIQPANLPVKEVTLR